MDGLRDFRARQTKTPFGHNVAELYVDVTDLPTQPTSAFGNKARYEYVDGASMSPAKRQALGLARNSRYLVITNASDLKSSLHSEPKVILAAIEALRALSISSQTVLSELEARAQAIITERSPCMTATPKTCLEWLKDRIKNARVLYLVPHRPQKNAEELRNLWQASHLAKAAENEVKRQRQLAEELFLAELTQSGKCPDDGTVTGSLGGEPVDIRLAACGETEESGLARALAAETGGIDFTSLELRYLRDAPGSDETRDITYAFTADSGAGNANVVAGLRNADQASDAFFVWLALPAADFWVNLNPNEPHRIIDKDFGRTDAGRILLEADLQLKKTVADLTDPRNRTGHQFWAQLRGREKCVSMRQWIVPAPAAVYATDEELHILHAPLQVMMETEYLDDKGTGTYRSCERQSAADEEHNEKVYRDRILPLVERRVSSAPEYAELRRVYLSRVAAEWVRERHGYQQTAYGEIIGSGKIDRWVTEEDWKPTDTFRRYVRSYTEHEFEVTDKFQQGNTTYTRTYVFGGVDFSHVPRQRVSAKEYARDFPGLSDAVEQAADQPTRDPNTKKMWFGATAVFADPSPADQATDGDEPEPHGTGVRSALLWGATLVPIALIILARRIRDRRLATPRKR
ncbi:hypothetical protein ABN034_24455 [Actinopolymorpha sp. B11F2]|uniref:hypothetical protein n=1 Tax=Actinopolymorpha sp. B11F2 TaxID=3160862 RepID=UPI0032E3BCD6